MIIMWKGMAGELQHQHLFSRKELSQPLWTHLNYKKSLWYISLTRQTVKITATFHMAVLRVVGGAHCKTRELHRPLLSSKNLHFQNGAKCTTFLVKMSFICKRMKNHFHMKGWALNLVLIQRSGGGGRTRKWPIVWGYWKNSRLPSTIHPGPCGSKCGNTSHQIKK